MAKIIPITEHHQHFLAEMERKFLGRCVWRDQAGLERLLEADSQRQRDRCAVRESYQRRTHERQPYRKFANATTTK